MMHGQKNIKLYTF